MLRRNLCHLPTASPLVLGSHNLSTLSLRQLAPLSVYAGSLPPLLPFHKSDLEEVGAGVPDLRSPGAAGGESDGRGDTAGRCLSAGQVRGWSLAGRDGAGRNREATAAAVQLQERGPQEAELGCGAGRARGKERRGVEGQSAGLRPAEDSSRDPWESPAWRATWRERVAERSATSPGCLQTLVHRGVPGASREAPQSWLHLG